MELKRISSKTCPLCFLPDGKLVCYKNGDILIFDGKNEVRRLSLFNSYRKRLLGRSKLISRLLRLGVRAAEIIDDERIVLSIGNMLYELNVNTGVFSKGYFCGEGIRPLLFTTVANTSGFEDGIYFGGYLGNMEKNPVNVYHRAGEDNWDVVYTFPKGAINHVHAIVSDSYRKCLWIFTGDFDESAAIWKATDGFKNVECVAFGDQKWRGCVAFSVPEGLLYATDAPFANNHIYLFKEDGTSETICDLAGSSIYGCRWNNQFVFSTAVEADGRNETMLKLLFGWCRGEGIKDHNTHIYVGNLSDGFQEVYKERKDLLPFIFQFGSIKFPTGLNNGNILYFQPVATKRNDMQLLGLVKLVENS